MKRPGFLALLPFLALLGCDDRSSSSALPTAPEGAVSFRLHAADSLPQADSVRIHVVGQGVDRDTVLDISLKKGGIPKLPLGVALTATVEGLRVVNGRNVVVWSATEPVTLSSTVERNVVDLSPQKRELTPIVALEFPTLLQFSGRGLKEDTLLFKAAGDTATLQFSARGLDSVWLDGTAIVAKNGLFTVTAALDSLPRLTLVGNDRMSRTWVLAPKALGDALVLAVAAQGRTLGSRGDTLVDSMDYVVPAGRAPLQVPGAVSVREGTQVWTAEGGVVSLPFPVPAAGSDSLHVLVGRDALGRRDTLLVRVVRASDRVAPQVAVEVRPRASVASGTAVEASLVFTVVEDSLRSLEVDGVVQSLVDGRATVTKSLGATEGWTALWKAVDLSGNESTGQTVLRRHDASERDTTAPVVDSVGVDVRSWNASGVSWIRGGSVQVRVKASDDRGVPQGVWLRNGIGGDSMALSGNGTLWGATVDLDRDTILEILARDEAGNVSSGRTLRVRIDDQPPQFVAPDSLLRGPQAIEVAMTLGDPGAGLLADSLTQSLDGLRSSFPTKVDGDVYTLTLPKVTSSGRHVLGLRACDNLQQCAVDSVVIRIDVEGPVASGLPQSGARLVADSTGGFSAALAVADPSGVKWVKAVSGSVEVPARINGSSWQLSVPSLPAGASSWSLQAADELGNLSSASFLAYRVPPPKANVVGQVAAGTIATVRCTTGVVVVNGIAQKTSSYSSTITGALSVAAHCLEAGVGRSSTENFAWTVGTVVNSALSSVGDSVTDSSGALSLELRVANAASISNAVATWPASATGGVANQGTGVLDVSKGMLGFALTGLPEGVTQVTVTVTDLDGDKWYRDVNVRRVQGPTTSQTTALETFGNVLVRCSKADDVLWLGSVSQSAMNGIVPVKGDVSVNARCVDAAGHSSASRLLTWSLASSAKWTLLNGNAAMSVEKQQALLTTVKEGGEPILVVGNRSEASLQLLRLDRTAPGENLVVASAISIRELDTLVLAKGRDAGGSGWVAGTAGGQLFVAQLTHKGAWGPLAFLDPSKVSASMGLKGWRDVHAAVRNDSVFLVAYDIGSESYRAAAYSMSTAAYVTLDLDGILQNSPYLWVSDLGSSTKALVLSGYDRKAAGPVSLQVPSGKSFSNNCGADCGGAWFPQVAKEAALGWILSSPLPGNGGGKWSLMALASSGSLSGGGTPSWSYEGGDPLAAPTEVFFGSTQGWIAQSGSYLWRFDLADPSAVKEVEKVRGVTSGGVVDPDGHAWITYQESGVWKLLRASP